VGGFAHQIGDQPMFLPWLKVIDPEVGHLAPAQTTSGH
jgi:hypothetical protein